MVNTTQISTTTSNTNTSALVDELRPHSSPGMNSNQTTTPSSERKSRHCSVSTDSLYQPAAVMCTDKRSSAGSIDNFGENFISFTNASYCSSSEWQVGKSDIYPLHKTVPCRSLSLESCEEESSQNEEVARVSEQEIRDEKPEERTTTGHNVDFSQPKEGLCIFVIGGKYCGSQDCFAKGVDIWRCDITKRKYLNFMRVRASVLTNYKWDKSRP